jgi:putative ABC transport system permease protein
VLLRLAWENTRHEPGRLAASAGAVASSVMLVLVAVGLYFGLLDAIVSWPRSLPGALVVAEDGGSATLLHASSRLDEATVAAVRRTPGVAAAHELYGRIAWLARDGRQALAVLVGTDRQDEFGLPARMLAGERHPALGEIVVDRVLAHDLRVGVGDLLPVGNARLEVVGIAAGGNAVLGSYAFVARGTLELAGIRQPGFLFVALAPDADPVAVRARLAALPRVRVFGREEFLRMNQALARQMILPLIAVIVLVTAVVSGNTVALTLWAATIERRAEYGLLVALGLRRSQLYAVAVLQSLLAAAVGCAAGLAGGFAVARLVEWLQPRFVTLVPPAAVALIALGAAAVAVAAAVRPVRAVARIDPALVFRA